MVGGLDHRSKVLVSTISESLNEAQLKLGLGRRARGESIILLPVGSVLESSQTDDSHVLLYKLYQTPSDSRIVTLE